MNLSINVVRSVLNLYSEMLNNNSSLVYMGEFTHQITKMFTSMANEEMERNHEEASTRRKVFHVMVETLQNMNKHSSDYSEKSSAGSGLFIIGKKGDTYYVITSNRVSNDKVENLKKSIDKVNASSKEELTSMYRKQIKEGKLSEKSGAGLGLIDIARKTGQQFEYQFIPFDQDNSLFILKTNIVAH